MLFVRSHITDVISRANRTVSFFSQVKSTHRKAKGAAFRTVVRPVLEYPSLVWDPISISVEYVA